MAATSALPRLLFPTPISLISKPATRLSSSTVSTCRHRALRRPDRRAAFSTSKRKNQPETSGSHSQQRYGTANEPPPHFKPQQKDTAKEKKDAQQAKLLPSSEYSQSQQQEQQQTSQQQQQQQQPSQQQQQQQSQELQQQQSKDDAQQPTTDKEKVEQRAKEAVMGTSTAQETRGSKVDESAASSTADEMPTEAPTETPYTKQSALQTILSMDPPASQTDNLYQATDVDGAIRSKKPPHLEPPRYVHHFDTYTLVRDLQRDGGFSEQSAVHLMKAVRILLAQNMNLARDGLVSKGDAEMESYLFRAAASELRTEIRNVRSRSTDSQRSERTGLQHEVDILSQRISADTAALKDELKGMTDDRKMAVRMERREVENQVQELNYKITTLLNSEMKSEVEGLRWILVRRTAIALVAVAGMVLAALRYSAHVETKKEVEKQKELDKRKYEAQRERDSGGSQSFG